MEISVAGICQVHSKQAKVGAGNELYKTKTFELNLSSKKTPCCASFSLEFSSTNGLMAFIMYLA